MVLIWWEIVLIVGLNAAVLAGFGVVVVKGWLPKKEKDLLSKGEIWMGGAIGRFMANLSAQATEEEGGSPSGSPGALELGGFKINIGTIKELMAIAPQIIQLAKTFGLLKGGGGGGAHPFSP